MTSFNANGEQKLRSLDCDLPNPNYTNNHNKQVVLNGKSMVIGSGDIRGLRWKWLCTNDTSTMTTTSEKVFSSYIQLTWDPETMAEIEGFRGTLKFILTGPNLSEVTKNVEFTVNFSGEWIGERNLHILKIERSGRNQSLYTLKFELTCVACYPEAEEEIPSLPRNEPMDGALLIGNQVVYVNKAFLSFHSEYFERMFSGNFKERDQDLIEITDINLEDFYGLLTLILPDPTDPPEEKVDRYLELADMYLMPGVTRQLEKFLQNSPRVKAIEKIRLADKHGLEKLLRSTLSAISELDGLKALTRLPEFAEFGNDAKALFMERFMHFL